MARGEAVLLFPIISHISPDYYLKQRLNTHRRLINLGAGKDSNGRPLGCDSRAPAEGVCGVEGGLRRPTFSPVSDTGSWLMAHSLSKYRRVPSWLIVLKGGGNESYRWLGRQAWGRGFTSAAGKRGREREGGSLDGNSGNYLLELYMPLPFFPFRGGQMIVYGCVQRDITCNSSQASAYLAKRTFKKAIHYLVTDGCDEDIMRVLWGHCHTSSSWSFWRGKGDGGGVDLLLLVAWNGSVPMQVSVCVVLFITRQ